MGVVKSKKRKCPRRDSNAQPTDSKSGTLSIELRGRARTIKIKIKIRTIRIKIKTNNKTKTIKKTNRIKTKTNPRIIKNKKIKKRRAKRKINNHKECQVILAKTKQTKYSMHYAKKRKCFNKIKKIKEWHRLPQTTKIGSSTALEYTCLLQFQSKQLARIATDQYLS